MSAVLDARTHVRPLRNISRSIRTGYISATVYTSVNSTMYDITLRQYYMHCNAYMVPHASLSYAKVSSTKPVLNNTI
jgi:hypothetical protein